MTSHVFLSSAATNNEIAGAPAELARSRVRSINYIIYTLTSHITGLFDNITATAEKINRGCSIPEEWTFKVFFAVITVVNTYIAATHLWPKFKNFKHFPPEFCKQFHYLILCQIVSAVVTPLTFLFFIRYLAQIISIITLCLMIWITMRLIRYRFGRINSNKVGQNRIFKLSSNIIISLIISSFIISIIYGLIIDFQQSMFTLILVFLTFSNFSFFIINIVISPTVDEPVYDRVKNPSSNIKELSTAEPLRICITVFATILWTFEISSAVYLHENKKIACDILYCIKILPVIIMFVAVWCINYIKSKIIKMFPSYFPKKPIAPEEAYENIEMAVICSYQDVVERAVDEYRIDETEL